MVQPTLRHTSELHALIKSLVFHKDSLELIQCSPRNIRWDVIHPVALQL